MAATKCTRCGGSGNEPDPVTIGAQLRKQRESLDISQGKVAKWMNVHQAYLSDLEKGNRHWSPVRISCYKSALAAIQKDRK